MCAFARRKNVFALETRPVCGERTWHGRACVRAMVSAVVLTNLRYVDISGATNVPARYYRVRLVSWGWTASGGKVWRLTNESGGCYNPVVSRFARSVLLVAGLLLGAGCAFSNNNPQHDPLGQMYDERTGQPVEPVYDRWR
jgi:hypothetical protein